MLNFCAIVKISALSAITLTLTKHAQLAISATTKLPATLSVINNAMVVSLVPPGRNALPQEFVKAKTVPQIPQSAQDRMASRPSASTMPAHLALQNLVNPTVAQLEQLVLPSIRLLKMDKIMTQEPATIFPQRFVQVLSTTR